MKKKPHERIMTRTCHIFYRQRCGHASLEASLGLRAIFSASLVFTV